MNNKPIPVNTPLLSGNELKYVSECITSGWISSEGPFVKDFETKYASYVNRRFGIAVSSGSAALDIAVKALDIGREDEVIMPTFTIISPAQSIVTAGALPVLVDSDPVTWNIDINQLEAKITSRTKAIMVVHVYGLPADMDPILDLCHKYRLKLIEDAAEMHGQTYKGRKCGSFGDISTFSFYPNKHITTGEGGIIVCNDQKLAERCRKLRNLAFEDTGPRFVHHEIGWNYRLTNLQAALGLAQLEKIEFHLQRKREIGNRYNMGLKNFTILQTPLPETHYAENIYWVYGLVAETQEKKEKLITHLNQNKIGTRPFFWCMHEQPVFQKMNLFSKQKYPIAERLSRHGFYIPCGVGIKDEEIDIVIKTIYEAI